jgi:MoaA/NifB/PqqE/SkfB family radical SAM enzyme
MKKNYRKLFDHNIVRLFWKAFKIGINNPKNLGFLCKALLDQVKAANKRKKLSANGLEVPPLLIVSLTRKCNLNCAGCYSKILHHSQDEELSTERFSELLDEASSLGISIILLAGGEPLLRRDLLEIAARYPRIIFPIFTNSLLLDGPYLNLFARHRQLIPVISLEGREAATDKRRGDGIYTHFSGLPAKLRAAGIFWGISYTLTQPEYENQLNEKMILEQMDSGCRLFFFVEYVPVAPDSRHLLLSQSQKSQVEQRIKNLSNRLPGLFIGFPGNEEQYGGCLAAGRGFLHINPAGLAEPCPFAPFSDIDLKFASLREALASPLMRMIRSSHHLLTESEGGCALWANREYVSQLTEKCREGTPERS